MNFNLLNDSCFILIAPFDIFERGLCRYTFEGTCRECPDLKLGDGSIKVFINTKGRNREEFSEEFLDFMDYVTNSSAKVAGRTKSEKIKLIHRQVQKIKESEKMGVKYMQRWEELAEAKEEGGELMLIKQVCKKLGKGKSMEEIAEALEEDMEKIEKICEAAEGFAPDYDCEEIYEKLYEE